jgi:hypothetical protein
MINIVLGDINMWNFLKSLFGSSTQAEPVAPYKIEAPVADVPQEPARSLRHAPAVVEVAPVAVASVAKIKKVVGTKPRAPKAKPAAITATPKAK